MTLATFFLENAIYVMMDIKGQCVMKVSSIYFTCISMIKVLNQMTNYSSVICFGYYVKKSIIYLNRFNMIYKSVGVVFFFTKLLFFFFYAYTYNCNITFTFNSHIPALKGKYFHMKYPFYGIMSFFLISIL